MSSLEIHDLCQKIQFNQDLISCEFLPKSSWTGHIPFLRFLVLLTRPHRFVELGTHYGLSYFSICELAKKKNLEMDCYAIDNWVGDLHVGKLSEDVYLSVVAENEKYHDFSKIIRDDFTESSSLFKDETIDLLHIDGQHTYEDVLNDFNTWKRKLSKSSIVVFHDIHVRTTNFGVYKLWEELSQEYVTIELPFQYGLGVLLISEYPNSETEDFFGLMRGQHREALVGAFAFCASKITDLIHNKYVDALALLSNIEAEKENLLLSHGSIKESNLLLQQSIEKLSSDLYSKDQAIKNMKIEQEKTEAELTQLHLEFGETQSRMYQILTSEYWKYGSPIRKIFGVARTIRESLLGSAIIGGVRRLVIRLPFRQLLMRTTVLWRYLKRSTNYIRHFGLRKFLSAVVRKLGSHKVSRGTHLQKLPRSLNSPLIERDTPANFPIRPYYLDPFFCLPKEGQLKPKIALHVHLHEVDGIDYLSSYLNNIPFEYDLLVSNSGNSNDDMIQTLFRMKLQSAQDIQVHSVPNIGRDLSHLYISLREKIREYEIVGHFHFKKSPHLTEMQSRSWMNEIFESLLGSPEKIYQIVQLLVDKTNFVYANTSKLHDWDESGWSDNFQIAQEFLFSRMLQPSFPLDKIEFPRGNMFWARVEALVPIFDLDLRLDDLPEEPIPVDGTLLHALERLTLVLISRGGKYIFRIESQKISDHLSLVDYENQFDFSNLLMKNKPRILAYYLPQFHPIPENDLWHGVGFTEWNKVRSANPQFVGHYQQHVPHEDIGYYDLGSDEILRNQAQMMKASGVFGLVFYHYWFEGKMVLEGVAQRLLRDKSIQIPFAFCWANENWTRKWDGNEEDILLKQSYSKDDALQFIRYLIPFFKDSRYIRKDSRPILFVYRTINAANWNEYLAIWEDECLRNGVNKPLVVATLTRNARSANESGMDAAVERVLHDWVEGRVSPINDSLNFYDNFHGSVLDYSEVLQHYSTKLFENSSNPSEWFYRSIVPNWDNTARYGNFAYILHGSSPAKFQMWLQNLIKDYEQKFKESTSEEFILVNAWNEWAEGAHLEPDKLFGYSYLNSVGRALSELNYEDLEHIELKRGIRIEITFGVEAKRELQRLGVIAKRFLKLLKSTTVIQISEFIVRDDELADILHDFANVQLSDGGDHSYSLHFETLVIFTPSDLDNLFKFSLRHPRFAVCGSSQNEPSLIYDKGLLVPWIKRGSLQLKPSGEINGWKVSPTTRVFNCKSSTPSTESDYAIHVIVRFHAKGDKALLFNNLKSLYTQQGVKIQVHLCIQDLAANEYSHLVNEILSLFSDDQFLFSFKRFNSTEKIKDLRSKMLNETLKGLPLGYVTILDYDDILFPFALRTMAQRLEITNKAVTFGRVYSTYFDEDDKVVSRVKVYEWGRTYEDFLTNNITPIHGLMMNTNMIDTAGLRYHDDQKYMEDYFLTLQILRQENADWESLSLSNYIGDYSHRTSSESQNTLALHDNQQRVKLQETKEYIICASYIDQLRNQLMNES